MPVFGGVFFLVIPALEVVGQAKTDLEVEVGTVEWYGVARGIAHFPKNLGDLHLGTDFQTGLDGCEVGVEGVKGRVERVVLEHEVFSVGAVSGGGVEVAHDSVHGGKYVVFGPASGVPLDGIEVEPFMKLISVVAYASEGAGGKRLVGARFLEEGGVAHPLGKGGVGCGPGEMKGGVFAQEGDAEEEGKKKRKQVRKRERAHA